MKLIIEISGWLGSVLILAAYALLTSRKVKSQSRVYQMLNVAGSFLLLVNTIYHRAIPPAALNLVWMGIGVFSVIRSKGHQRVAG